MTPTEKREREAILRKANEWRTLIEGPDATDADRAAFEAWRAADARHVELYHYAVTFYEALGTLDEGDMGEDILRRTPREHLTALSDRVAALFAETRFRMGAAGVALASVIFAMVIFTGPDHNRGLVSEPAIVARYETAIADIQTITLDDGTVITLGAASAVETSYSDTERKATVVAGSAFFDVAADGERAFTVTAGDLEAQVVGTQFDVTRSGETVRVAVAEGEVQVSHPLVLFEKPTNMLSRRNLSAGQQVAATSTDGLESVKPVAISAVGAWREDKLYYNGARLSELVADANRYSDARVVIEGDVETISNYLVRGSFNARDIDGMLSTLSEIYPLDIDRSTSGQIRIRARPDRER